MRHQLHAQNLASQLSDLVNGARQLDAATFAAAPGVNLRLDDPHRAAQLLRGFHRFLDRECGNATRHRHTKLTQDFLALVFVNFHKIS